MSSTSPLTEHKPKAITKATEWDWGTDVGEKHSGTWIKKKTLKRWFQKLNFSSSEPQCAVLGPWFIFGVFELKQQIRKFCGGKRQKLEDSVLQILILSLRNQRKTEGQREYTWKQSLIMFWKGMKPPVNTEAPHQLPHFVPFGFVCEGHVRELLWAIWCGSWYEERRGEERRGEGRGGEEEERRGGEMGGEHLPQTLQLLPPPVEPARGGVSPGQSSIRSKQWGLSGGKPLDTKH